jgi:hypothetical protein
MSAWGKADNKTASGTLSIASTGVVTGSSTQFTTESAVGDFIRATIAGAGADQERSWIIKSITSNTVAAVIPADPELEYATAYANFTTFGAQTYQLSEKPISIASDSNTQASQVFGVDVNEMAANKLEEGAAHTGWNKVKVVGSRKIVETLVALSKNGITSDIEDVVFEDFLITITGQPADSEEATGSAVTFEVAAAITGTGGTLTYQWQVDSGSGFGNISNGGVNSGATTDTLAISDNTGLDGNEYRCVVSATGADSVTSSAATLTEAA